MIILRYLTAEIFKSQFAVFIVLMSIFMSQTFVRILADATEGKIPGYLVASIIGLRFPQLAAIILPLSVFLGVMLAYGRLYADQEMSVLKACGVSEWYVARVALLFATIMAIIGGSITLYFSPISAEYEYQVRENAAAEGVLSTLTAGRFHKAGKGDSVVFVQEIERRNSEMKKVFVAQANEDGVESVVFAQTGRLQDLPSGQQDLILSAGHRYNFDENSDLQRLNFSQYQILMEEQAVERRSRNLAAQSTLELVNSKDVESQAEFQWRLAIPLTIPILALIAVPLSSVNPRQGRFGKILPGLVIFFSYYILLLLAKSALEDGKIPLSVGLWWIHIIGLCTAAMMLMKDRSSGGKLRQIWLSTKSKKSASSKDSV
ncbi:LPS export ABC transporter permease LptF [Psychrosphaera aestuarii]|uniref:LPS export ABC transporter permease LptF n=1 Tax=Psychrosphaera aestuarii TaxID=1266052 RepID=UPI001B336598|nr:LPS export ABC transporter permease LptF [Psychrosphaera aestuarii]